MKRSKTAPETIGERLRKGREKLGLSTAEVAQRTKIHPRIVIALEEDQVVDRLSPVYVKSFLRMYARLVGLDETEMAQEFSEQHPAASEPLMPQAASTVPVPVADLPTASWTAWRPTREHMLAAGGVIVVLLGVWSLVAWLAHHPIARRTPAQLKAAASVRRQSASWFGNRTKTASQRMLPATSAPVLPSITVPAQEPLKLQITAKERTWLRVTADGKVIFQNVLDKGRTEAWTAADTLVLWLGNAGGVELALNGQALGAPGRRGEVIRDLRVSHSGIQVKR